MTAPEDGTAAILIHPTATVTAQSAAVITARIIHLWGQLRRHDECAAVSLARHLPALSPRKDAP